MAQQVEREPLIVGGREIAITNPHKELFPEAGHTKLDVARYYMAVADGALRAAGGRPNVLKRYPNGIHDEFFYQKRAPTPRPEWIDSITLRFPSGRSAEEVVMPARFASRGDVHHDMDARAFSIESLLDLSERQEKDGQGDAPWPPHFNKQAGEPRRVQPSRRRKRSG